MQALVAVDLKGIRRRRSSVIDDMAQLLIIQTPGERAAALAVLADEMTEDPRCRMVLRGLASDGDRGVLVTTWDDEVALEVSRGLEEVGWTVSAFRLAAE